MPTTTKFLPTVEIHDPKNEDDYVVINQTDFDARIHVEYAKPRPKNLCKINASEEEIEAFLNPKKKTASKRKTAANKDDAGSGDAVTSGELTSPASE